MAFRIRDEGRPAPEVHTEWWLEEGDDGEIDLTCQKNGAEVQTVLSIGSDGVRRIALGQQINHQFVVEERDGLIRIAVKDWE